MSDDSLRPTDTVEDRLLAIEKCLNQQSGSRKTVKGLMAMAVAVALAVLGFAVDGSCNVRDGVRENAASIRQIQSARANEARVRETQTQEVRHDVRTLLTKIAELNATLTNERAARDDLREDIRDLQSRLGGRRRSTE